MGDNTGTEIASKKSFLRGIKSEFKKIIWPDKETLIKQTTAITGITVVLGIIISLVDFIIQIGVEKILMLG